MTKYATKLTGFTKEQTLIREVKKYNDGQAYVILPKKYIGREVQIIIWRKGMEPSSSLNNSK